MEYRIIKSDELQHYGIRGQKWGVRRFQNEDNTWTEAGKERYGDKNTNKKERKAEYKELKTAYDKAKYASAVTNKYQYDINKAKRKGNTAQADALYERGMKSAKHESVLTQSMLKKYDSYVKKYGNTGLKKIQLVTDDGGTRVTMNGKREVNRILNQNTMKFGLTGQILIGPVGAAIGGYAGYTKDTDRRNAYEKELDKY